jgi:nitric oxide dioxygenase
MTLTQIALVQSSFEKVAPMGDAAAALFYGRLFEIAPQVRPLFKDDIKSQGRNLMAMLATIVRNLDRLEEVMPAIKALAVRHVSYGVRPEHYDKVGDALLWTLERGLGDAFTPQASEAWRVAYGVLSGVMIDAAYSHPGA